MVYVMLCPLLNVLYFYISLLQSMCAVPNMAFFFLVLFDFELSRCAAQVFDQRF